jgi:Protein of unknown function (DUF2384)
MVGATAKRNRQAAASGPPRLAEPMRGAGLVMPFLDERGTVAVERVAQSFGLSKAQLAATVGVRPETLQSTRRAQAPKTQARLREMLEIVARVTDWAGGPLQAMAWYRAEPLPGFGGRTAESLVKDGKAAAVRDHLDRVALGGFA